MTMKDFKGAAKPLDAYDVAQLAYRIDVTEDHMQAFLNVESRARGFDREGRPVILFEPHIFYRHLSGETRDKAVAAGLAYRKWGERPYPSDSYPRLLKAVEIDESAALMACSWGMTQVLGENYAMVGYSTVQQMVLAFMADEEEHVEAMVKFILASGIDDDIRNERWETVARVYNGPGYRRNNYHTKLASEFRKMRGVPDSGWEAPTIPDERVYEDPDTIRSVQKRLRELDYHEVGKADGVWGTKTRAAVLGFRADHELPLLPVIDDELLAALMTGDKREIGEERAETTVADERRAGSRQIASADKAQAGGGIIGVGGILAGIGQVIGGLGEDPASTAGEFLAARDVFVPLIEAVKSIGPWAALGIGGYIVYQQWKVKKARVEDVREGKHVGRS